MIETSKHDGVGDGIDPFPFAYEGDSCKAVVLGLFWLDCEQLDGDGLSIGFLCGLLVNYESFSEDFWLVSRVR